MKKVYYILALTATLITGCSQNEELSMIESPNGNENTVGKNSLTATFDGGTRTMSPDGKTTKWVDHDQIYVYGSDGTVTYTTSQGGGTTAIFTCSGGSAISNMKYAVYGPIASSTPSFSNEGKTVTGITIPTNWTYSTNNNCANCIMMGEINTTNYTVAFKNAGAILYITLGSNITFAENTNLTVTTASTPITGAATVTWSETDKAPTYSCSGDNTITITGLTSGTEQKIIVPMPVFSNPDVITVKLVTTPSEGEPTEKLIFSESATLERNKYYCIDYTTEDVQTVFSEVGLTDALTAGNKVALGKNLEIATYTLTHNNAEIDLNGHTLTATKIITNSNNLTIIGTTAGSALVTDIESEANLTLTNVKLTGSVKATADSYPNQTTDAKMVRISGGSISATSTAVYVKYTDLEISGCSLSVTADQLSTADNGVGYCIAVMGGNDVTEAPAKGNITLGSSATNSYVTTGTNNVYIFANEESHSGLILKKDNDTSVKITWKTPKPSDPTGDPSNE